MNEQRKSIFFNEMPLEQLKATVNKAKEKPIKVSLIFWFIFIQVCLAVFLLVSSFILPFKIF